MVEAEADVSRAEERELSTTPTPASHLDSINNNLANETGLIDGADSSGFAAVGTTIDDKRPEGETVSVDTATDHQDDAANGDSSRVSVSENNGHVQEAEPQPAEAGEKGPITLEDTAEAEFTRDKRHVKQERRHDTRNKLVLEKYTLYKTETRLYVIASDLAMTQYRILKIDRHYSPTDVVHELSITEDDMVYTKAEANEVIRMIGDGNKTVGGLTMVVPNFYGIVGFVRFTAGWYMILIKQRAAVGLVGGHYIYHCEESLMMPISSNAKPEKSSEENKLYAAFQQVDLSKNFYFSHSYDLTNTLQTNLTRPWWETQGDHDHGGHPDASQAAAPSMSGRRESSSRDRRHWVADHAFHEPTIADKVEDASADVKAAWGFNDKFMWNHFLLRPAFFEKMREGKYASCWVLPLVHGFVDQAKVSVFGRSVFVTLIARRSRYFAGARFLKRGVNDEGNVANDVESEQIVHEALTTSFYNGPTDSPDRQLTSRYTSFVQHRGSIPLSWQQDTSTSSLKPPIHLHLVDPYHSAAALHFDDLFCRYGTPIIVLNLIKGREHEARESKLIKPYKECIDYLNQFLPDAKKIKLIPFDMSAAYKNRSMDVIGVLEDIAEEVLETTKFFHSGPEPVAYQTPPDFPDASEEPYPYRSTPLLQRGICRTNCIDCLDRTNAAQFVIAKAAFGHQLHALGILSDPHLAYDNDAVNLLTEMYHDHGDTIALQYGGSHLVNTMDTYRKINQWQSHSRDMIEGIKRFYANVALDQDKQNSINLFLGIDSQTDVVAGYTPGSNGPALPTGGQMTDHQKPPLTDEDLGSALAEKLEEEDEEAEPVIHARRDYRYWYTPEHLQEESDPHELEEHMHAIAEEDSDYWQEYYRPRLFTNFERHFAFKVNSTARYNPRLHGHRFVADPNDLSPFKERPAVLSHPPRINVGVKRWMSVNSKRSSRRDSISEEESTPDNANGEDDSSAEGEEEQEPEPPMTTEALATRLLDPKVHHSEAEEYASYVDQYRNLNLSNELQYQHSAVDMELYERAVRLTKGGAALSDLLSVDAASEELYEKHVKSLRGYRAEVLIS